MSKVSSGVQRAIARCRDKFVTFRRAESNWNCQQAILVKCRTESEEAKKEAQWNICAFRRRLWHSRVSHAYQDLISNPRQFWAWASRTAWWNLKSSVSGVQLVKGVNGLLKTTLPEIVDAWKSHYANLASDLTGHSQDPVFSSLWADANSLPQLENLDDNISCKEMWQALKRMKTHQAPGSNRIPVDLYRCCLLEKRRQEVWDWAEERQSRRQPQQEQTSPRPGSPITDSLLQILNQAFLSGNIADNWTDSIVVSIPKKGDMSEMNNYRGISLMSTVLKIICVILSKQINVAAEMANRFSCSQAGFRKRKECITQAACLAEIIQRRCIADKDTFGLFVDFKKAYDTMPHEALFANLKWFGIHGRAYDFIVALYRQNTIQIRVGRGEASALSNPVPLLRGVRQGFPLSCVLFNIFINDLFNEFPHPGLLIPKGKPSEPDPEPIRIPGLLFADDALGLARSVAHLSEVCGCIGKWAEANEMSVGIGKCGIIEFHKWELTGWPWEPGDPDPTPLEYTLPSDDEAIMDSLSILGERVLIVDEYEYLGICITKSARLADMVELRVDSGRKTVMSPPSFSSMPGYPHVLPALGSPRGSTPSDPLWSRGVRNVPPAD